MKDIVDKVAQLLEKHFENNPARKPKLSDAQGLDASKFSVQLLSDLGNAQHKQTEVYEHIRTQERVGSSMVLGSSGAGKTRAAFEYLSHNKGFYLLGGDLDRSPGSQDLSTMLNQVGDTAKQGTPGAEDTSQENLRTVFCRYRVLLYIRYAVHNFIEAKLGRLTAQEWLFCQLFPKDLLGGDIFRDVLDSCIQDEGLITEFKAEDAREEITGNWSIVIDESQCLLEKPGYFLDRDGYVCSSLFALVKAAWYEYEQTTRTKPNLNFPVFLGTEHSNDVLAADAFGGMAKRLSALQDRVPFFAVQK